MVQNPKILCPSLAARCVQEHSDTHKTPISSASKVLSRLLQYVTLTRVSAFALITDMSEVWSGVQISRSLCTTSMLSHHSDVETQDVE